MTTTMSLRVDAIFRKKAAPAPKVAKKGAKKAAAPASKVAKGGKGNYFRGSADAALSKWYGPDRKLYLPGGLLDPSEVPAYLNGTLPGDYGYDPLGLGKSVEQVEKYRANELLHARWAMLAAAGALIPEGLQANGANIRGGTYFTTPFELANTGSLNYFAVPWGIITNPLPLAAVAVINIGLLTAVEGFRAKGEGPAGFSPGTGKFDSSIFEGLDPLYPGGPFDPLGLADDPEILEELKVKEIKNGRLAMVSVLGFGVQSLVTGEGPYANFSKHIADPFHNNLLTVIRATEERAPTL